jgi:mannose-6-phosphate isomerase-like protein (cupin superfamily)
MRIHHLERQQTKGWFAGPWNSDLSLAVGYANSAVDEPHLHRQITEIYLVGAGQATVRIEQETLQVEAGDVLIIEPGEAHTFLLSTENYFHFVLHTPGLPTDEARMDKVSVERARLGLRR